MGTTVKMKIDSLYANMGNYQHIVVLREEEGDRTFPMSMGIAEADAFDMALKNEESLTQNIYDVLCSIVEQYDGQLLSITIAEINSDIFRANIQLIKNDGPFEIRCRPGDGLNLAVRAGISIFIDEKALNNVEGK